MSERAVTKAELAAMRASLQARIDEHRRREQGRKPVEIVEFPPKLDALELWRRQAALDAAWERTLEARRELERQWASTCHRGPSDPDWKLR
jgi:hypothetical protein